MVLDVFLVVLGVVLVFLGVVLVVPSQSTDASSTDRTTALQTYYSKLISNSLISNSPPNSPTLSWGELEMSQLKLGFLVITRPHEARFGRNLVKMKRSAVPDLPVHLKATKNPSQHPTN